MTARERMLLIHRGEKRRRGIRGLAWSPLVNTATLAAYPAPIRNLSIDGFVELVGGDVYKYYGTCWKETRSAVHTVETPVADGAMRREYRTPVGSLFETVKGQRIQEWRLKDVHDYAAAEYLVEDLTWLPDYGAFEALEREIGDRGLAFPFLPASPVQELVQRRLGVEGFAYHLEDHRTQLERLMRVVQRKNEQLYRIAADSPSPFVDALIGPSAWLEPATDDEVRRNVEAIVTEDLLDRNIMLTAAADGLPGIPVERFRAVTEALRPFVFL